jgi:hypothetical protein
LKKCWLGLKIAKSRNDVKSMLWYAKGIRKFQKELGFEVYSFPDLRLYATDEDGSPRDNIEEDRTCSDQH